MNEVFITRISNFLPNECVPNDEMEGLLGKVNGKPSKSKAIVLRSNKIKGRYYALDKASKATHTNADMACEAVRNLFAQNPDEIKEVELLSCGTATPDQLMPSHAVMVHGLLPETGNIEVSSNAGSCCAGMHALKFAYLAIKSGEIEKAVSTGSERVSAMLKSDSFEEESKHLEALQENPYIAFDKDFLRWMLSDGAGGFLLENKRNENGLSLKIEWIELSSFAYKREACMYMGAEKLEDGTLNGYLDVSTEDILNKSVLSLKQDTKLLSNNIVELGFAELKRLLAKHKIDVNDIDYLLPHMSSYFFQDKIYTFLKESGIEIPYDRWFTNLDTKGNVGSGSIYIMLEELFNEKDLKKGQKILLAVPESARFSYAFCLLTVC